MTRQEFVEKWRHEFGGLVADAYCRGEVQGGELSMRMRLSFRKIDTHLAQIYESFQPKPQPEVNGKAAQPQRTA